MVLWTVLLNEKPYRFYRIIYIADTASFFVEGRRDRALDAERLTPSLST